MLQLSSSSAATSLREEAELLHIWIDRLPCSEAGDVGEEAKGDDHIFDRAGDPDARPGLGARTPGARALERGLCPGTFKVRLCKNLDFEGSYYFFSSFKLH